jgi:hypothetical protein
VTEQFGREFHGPRDYLDLAESPDATAEELRWLAASSYSFVVEAVARHPTTPADALERILASEVMVDGGDAILVQLAAHSSASSGLLAAIAERVPRRLHARDNPWAFAAGIALVSNPNTPDEALLRLVDDPQATTQFRKVAARETNHPALLDHLRADRSETVRRAATRNVGQPTPG